MEKSLLLLGNMILKGLTDQQGNIDCEKAIAQIVSNNVLCNSTLNLTASFVGVWPSLLNRKPNTLEFELQLPLMIFPNRNKTLLICPDRCHRDLQDKLLEFIILSQEIPSSWTDAFYVIALFQKTSYKLWVQVCANKREQVGQFSFAIESVGILPWLT